MVQVCYAEELGFTDVWSTEHYFTGESVYNDVLMFAAAPVMKTITIRLGFHHPVHHAISAAG